MSHPRRKGHRYYQVSEIVQIADQLKSLGYDLGDLMQYTLTELDHLANYERQ